MMRDDFAVFILSHGRASDVKTVTTLKKGNYTGKYYIIVDDEDDTVEEYKKNYGEDKVIVFNKQPEIDKTDTADNFNKHGVCVYARNVCFRIAKELNIDYFLELDDDYTSFTFRYDNDGKLSHKNIKDLDLIFTLMVDFLNSSDKITAVALAQGGDFIGGLGSRVWKQQIVRKCMNTWFFKTKEFVEFKGTFNDDVTTYTHYGTQGKVFFTIGNISIDQVPTQAGSGGMSDIYKTFGTYVKSFYSVMFSPSCVKVNTLNTTNKRFHHSVKWDYCTPCIISDRWKK